MIKIELKDIKCRYKQIIDYPDYYITEEGDIYSKRLRGAEKEPHLHKLTPKNPGRDNKYLNIILCNNGRQDTKSIHRLVAEHFVEGYFPNAVVNHKDGNNRNNHFSNLEWTSQKDNIRKSYKTSNIDQTRNYLWWYLFDSNGIQVGAFKGHQEMEEFIANSGLNVSGSMLTKHGKHNGYTIRKKDKSHQEL